MAIEKINTKFGSFYGYSQDHLFKCLKSGEFFDNKISEYIKENIRPDDICADVGANLGFFSVQLSKLCKRVYSFEPQKEVFKLLVDNLSINGCINVIAHNKALLDKECLLDFSSEQDGWVGELSEDYSKINSIGSISFSENKNGKFKSTTLDAVIPEKVNFIKIDAESADISIILGAENLIKNYHPTIIFEYNEGASKKNYNKTIDDLSSFIINYDYKLVKLDEGNWILR